jgi:UDP-glucose 4-epimerase
VSRVLVTGGAGMIGAAVVRRLLADPDYEVRVADERVAPQWMREGAEVHTGDLRVPELAQAAAKGCSHVIHLAASSGGVRRLEALPYTLAEASEALSSAVVRAAVEAGTERVVYVSSSRVLERAERFPTAEEQLARCPAPESAYGFSKLAGERSCRAAQAEHGLAFTICRPSSPYGPGELPGEEAGIAHVVPDLIGKVLSGARPVQILGSGEQTRTPTYVEDVAEGLVTAMRSAAALNEDFNLSAARELTVDEIAAVVWEACGEDPAELEMEHLPAPGVDVQRSWPSAEKARTLLDWEARVSFEDGIAATVAWMREQREVPTPRAKPAGRRRRTAGSGRAGTVGGAR